MRGICNKCGGRIALFGRRDTTEPQRAEALPDLESSWVMRQAGQQSPIGEIVQFDREAFEALMEEISNEAEQTGTEIHRYAPMLDRQATEEQLRGLRELGATESQMNGVTNFGDAVKLAEILEPPPSLEDLALLANWVLPTKRSSRSLPAARPGHSWRNCRNPARTSTRRTLQPDRRAMDWVLRHAGCAPLHSAVRTLTLGSQNSILHFV